MFTRSKEFYDLVNGGLRSIGYTGESSFDNYVNDVFAEKYNAEATFAQMGFDLDPEIYINPTYEQLEVNVRPYTLATYVDIDSDGATKSVGGGSFKTGGIPTFKHEVTLDRKKMREKILMAEALGGATADINNVILDQLFTNTDMLIGGNYNTFQFQRDQIVSTGKLKVDATNNPLGISLELDFGVDSTHRTTSKWYKVSGDTVTQETAVGSTIDPISVLKKVKRNAELVDYAPAGHWECAKSTFEAILAMPYFRKMYAIATMPTVTDESAISTIGAMADDDTIKTFIEKKIGASIVVVDHIGSVESYDKENKKIKYNNIQAFADGVMVYVPNGSIGTAQFGKPMALATPGARIALFDGGRTMLRQIFNDENMNQIIKSEVTGLCVPNKTRWFYYLTIKG